MPNAVDITEVTLGEVYRMQKTQGETLTAIRESIDKRPTREEIDRLEKSRDKEQEEQNQAIKALEDQNTWRTRTVGAALVTALTGLAVAVARTL